MICRLIYYYSLLYKLVSRIQSVQEECKLSTLISQELLSKTQIKREENSYKVLKYIYNGKPKSSEGPVINTAIVETIIPIKMINLL